MAQRCRGVADNIAPLDGRGSSCSSGGPVRHALIFGGQIFPMDLLPPHHHLSAGTYIVIALVVVLAVFAWATR